jgi:signal peptidase I
MSYFEQFIGFLLFVFFYLYNFNKSILVSFIFFIILFIIFYRINIKNSNFLINFIDFIMGKKSYKKQIKIVKPKMKRYHELSKRPKILPVIIPLIITGLTAYIILNQLVFLAIITSGSMSPTLEVKDLVLMQNLKIDSQQGDIIMFETKEATMPVIHRIYSVSGNEIRTKGDAVALADDWIVKKDQIRGQAVLFQSKPIIVKNIGEYLLFDPSNIQITKYGSEMYRVSQIIKSIKKLGLIIFIICILLYIFINFKSTNRSY